MSTATNASILKDSRILVADDEFMIAADLEFVLRDAGADVRLAATLDEALRSATDDELSGALLDVRLGTTSSLHVAEKLTERKIPFLFFSGQVLPPEISTKFPQARTLVKPVDYGTVLDAISQMLRAH
jgi:DNA-binding NtrC family response regulator